MRFRLIAIIIIAAIIIVGGYLYVHNLEYNIVRSRVDPLYIYFHKIQDSIKAKHYPINMDSLKRMVHDSMMHNSTYHKLQVLEDSVRAYKQPG